VPRKATRGATALFLDKLPLLKDHRPGLQSISSHGEGTNPGVPRQPRPKKTSPKNGANLGFEQTVWQAADKEAVKLEKAIRSNLKGRGFEI